MNISSYTLFFDKISLNVSVLIIIGLIISLFAAYLFMRATSNKWSYFLLFIGVAVFSSGFAIILQHMNIWDEQFHALVAKNMMKNPFKPYLLGEMHSDQFRFWTNCHIWLHKQPLFLWQIATSLKIFGTNIFALRLPSILMHAATSVLVLSISKRFLTPFLALIATFLFAFSEYQLSLLSGADGMDHNDIAFLFYCTASFWAWIKYNETKEFRYVILIGVFSGGAILCKWLVGLIVYAGWGIVILITQIREVNEWKNLFKALLVTLIISMPWQIYCYIQFPDEFLFEMNYNSLHFSESVEGHSGDVSFHFDAMKRIYGNGFFVSILIWIGIAIMLIKGFYKRSKIHLFSGVIFCVIYIFFSIAETKITAYTLVVSAIGFVAFFLLFQVIFEFLKEKKWSLKFNFPKFLIPIVLLFILMLHFQIKIVIDKFHLEVEDKFFVWRENKTKFIIYEIEKNNSKETIYFIKDDRQMMVEVNASFYTDAEIYPYFPDCEKLGKVIVVNGIDEAEDFTSLRIELK